MGRPKAKSKHEREEDEKIKQDLIKICIEKYKASIGCSVNYEYEDKDIWIIENVVKVVVDSMKRHNKKKRRLEAEA